MGFGIGDLLLVSLLIVNAIAVLSEERFLAKIGWSAANNQETAFQHGQSLEPGIKMKLINLISAVRTLMRIPLVLVNMALIVYLLILG